MSLAVEAIGPLHLRVNIERWPLLRPFRITGHTWSVLDVLKVSLTSNGKTGSGESAGVYYRNDQPESMLREVEALRPRVELGIDRGALQRLLPPGGARNALDCALWDLCAKLSGVPAWKTAGLDEPKPLLTTFTCGADTPETMADAARAYKQARAIKIKLTGEPIDAARVQAIREARGDVWLGVDANQGLTPKSLDWLMPTLIDTNIQLIEQPFPVGQESLLDGFDSPIPIAADESVQTLKDVCMLSGRFHVVNIKLDKCGGLTEGLLIARAVRALGLDVMVGNMLGTSLAMAPAFLLGQVCKIIDLDGPMFLTKDREIAVEYRDGFIEYPKSLWGDS